MKAWSERKVGNGIKNPNSKNMVGLNNIEDFAKKIKKQKENQRKLFKTIKDEMKKVDQFRISIDGLQNLSDSSTSSIQIKREKALNKTKIAINELLENAKMLKKLENQYRKQER